MAMLAPIIGGIGGGGAFGIGSLLSIASTGLSIASTLSAGETDAVDYKTQAKAEQFNARSREIDRKRNLIRSLALQNVRAGASGITSGPGSSAQAIMMEDVSRSGLDEATAAAGTSMRVSQLKQNAKSAKQFSLLSAAGEAVRYGKRVKKRGSI